MSVLHYSETGKGEPLILLHSGGMSGAEWQPQLRYLGRHFRVITPDQLGHGRSPMVAEQLTIGDIGRQMIQLLDALDIDKAHICGLSIGANSAVFLGIREPARCLSLVVAGGGHGSVRDALDREDFERDFTVRAERLLQEGMATVGGEQAERNAKALAVTLSEAEIKDLDSATEPWCVAR